MFLLKFIDIVLGKSTKRSLIYDIAIMMDKDCKGYLMIKNTDTFFKEVSVMD